MSIRLNGDKSDPRKALYQRALEKDMQFNYDDLTIASEMVRHQDAISTERIGIDPCSPYEYVSFSYDAFGVLCDGSDNR